AINFEGDVRSHALIALGGARRRVGFAMAGGGPLLTDVVEHRPDRHTSDNAAALVAAAFPGSPGPSPRLSPGAEPAAQPAADFRLDVPDDARLAARALIGPHPRYIVVHASGGRAIKQWDLDRFAAATTEIARAVGAAVVLSGAPGDAPLTAQVRAALPADIAVVDLTGRPDLLVLAAVLEGARLVLTGDTGPMHLAAAVRAPVVAVFGPSMPVRYAPRSTAHRVVRVDLWCAPCNMIRKPPARCQGHTPDCLTGVTVDAVIAAALSLLAETEAART
ncbi:MAG TPA: glycosyltransferase family 9 protein, partial [Vicinamibacterales bacterium]|nr:glycosyltransferase family 9 protein [Vicinamibacterales bacterium]